MKYHPLLILALPFIFQACNAVDCVKGETVTIDQNKWLCSNDSFIKVECIDSEYKTIDNTLWRCNNGSFENSCINGESATVDNKHWYCINESFKVACDNTCKSQEGESCIDYCKSQGSNFCFHDKDNVYCAPNGKADDKCSSNTKGCDGNTSWSCVDGNKVKKDCKSLTCSKGECIAQTPTAGESCTSGTKGCDGNISWSCVNGNKVKKDCESLTCRFGECGCYDATHLYHNVCEADDVNACGSHENNCTTNINGWKSGKCNSGKCVATTCIDGYHTYQDICEADSVNACGSHENNCTTAIAGWQSGICENGYCQAQTCIENMHPNEGICLVDDVEHCGTKQINCAETVDNWLTGTCTDGKCQIETFTFGNYEQDNNTNNGKEPIVWRVLGKNASGHSLVISEKALDAKPYGSGKSITWETSTIRSWLNGYAASHNAEDIDYTSDNFIDAAFTAEEKSRIITSKVPARANPDSDTAPGNDTNDKLFLLSITEANTYFTSDEARKAVATRYAVINGADAMDENGFVLADYLKDDTCINTHCYTHWWLRAPAVGSFMPRVARVDDYTGAIDLLGHEIMYKQAVRPAFWIKL